LLQGDWLIKGITIALRPPIVWEKKKLKKYIDEEGVAQRRQTLGRVPGETKGILVG